MGFGRSAKKSNQPTENQSTSNNTFLPLTQGTRVFRVAPGAEEIRVKRHWIAKEADGTWVPAFGFNRADKREKKPVIVAVFDADRGVFVGDNSRWRDNPIDAFVAANGLDASKNYAQERFYLSVIDLTPVVKDAEGKVYWPDLSNSYPNVTGATAKAPHNQPMILEGSSGDPDGKSMYAALIRLLKTTLGPDGEVLPIYDYEIKIVTSGENEKTQRDIRDGRIYPLSDELSALQQYDLASWLKPWPNEAISALMGGAEYSDVLTQYNIQSYPKLIPTVPLGGFDD